MVDLTRKELVEMLYAYSIGCLDKTEFLKLREYIRSSDDYTWEEMGEFQNLSAMLPAILNIETPTRQLKDKVARKLYRLREQKRPPKNITEIKMFKATQSGDVGFPDLSEEKETSKFEKKFTDEGLEVYQPVDRLEEESFEQAEDMFEEKQFEQSVNETETEQIPFEKIPEIETPPAVKDFEEIIIEEAKPEIEIKEERISEVPKAQRESRPVRPGQQTQIKERVFSSGEQETTSSKTEAVLGEKTDAQTSVKKEESKPVVVERRKEGIPLSTFLLSLVLVVILIGAGFGYYYYNGIIEDKDNRIKSLQSAFDNLVHERNTNNELLQLMKAPDLFVSILKPVDPNSVYTGKIVASPAGNRGYIMLNNLPDLEESKIFQLWITQQGRAVSLGMLYPEGKEYTKMIDDISLIPFGEQRQFLLTEEFIGGGQRPSRQVYLIGE